MTRTLRNTALVAASGYVLMFFSEFAFYGGFSDPTSAPRGAGDLAVLWVAYTLMAYLTLAAIRGFQVGSVPRLLVVGAAYGWMLEGGIVATAYEALPWSLSFTALAWHMPIDVLFGLYVLPRIVKRRSIGYNILAAGLAGLLWGFWVTWPWADGVEGPDPVSFLVFAVATVALLLVSYAVGHRSGLSSFHPSRRGTVTAAVLFVVWYLLNTALAVPASLLILPLLIGVCFWALKRGPGEVPDLVEGAPARLPTGNLAAWLLFPVVAAAEYGLWSLSGVTPPAAAIVYLLLTPLGFGLFGWAAWKAARVPAAT